MPDGIVGTNVREATDGWTDVEAAEADEGDDERDVVELEGLPEVAGPSSNRADVVLQQRLPSPFDSQQYFAEEL